MPETIQKLKAILTKRDFLQLFGLLGCVMVTSILEVVGVFSILPFLQVVASPETIESNGILKWIKTTMQFSSDRSMTIWLGIGVLVVYFLTAIINVASSWLISRTVWGIAHQICMRLLNRYTQMPFEFFLANNSAELVKKVISDIHNLVSGILMASCQFIASAFKILSIIVFLFFFNPKLALLASAIYGGAYIALHLLRHRYLDRLGHERLEAVSLRIKSFTETLTGIRTLRVSGATDSFVKRFESASKRVSDIQPQFLLTNMIPKHAIELLAFGGIIGIVIYVLINDNNLLDIVPTLSVFTVATYKLLPALNTAFSQAANFSHNLPVVDVVYEDMRQQDDLLPRADEHEAASPLSFDAQISVNNASYYYSDESGMVLDGISLQIEKGSQNALVGTTGCGKSTLIDVMVGLLFPRSGSFTVDGVPICRKNVFNWQKTIAYVPQEIFLYDATISANIALGEAPEDVDFEKVKAAAQFAQAIEFIEATTSGFDTIIGERGVRLSGGQRQRLGLARAFYKQPQVLFLDEATSALDNVTEEAVMNAIENQLPGITLVMIAHRLSTVKSCDKIFYVEKGRIIDSGNYEQLAASCPRFRQMTEARDEKHPS